MQLHGSIKGLAVFHIFYQIYFVCKFLHFCICSVSSGLRIGRVSKVYFCTRPRNALKQARTLIINDLCMWKKYWTLIWKGHVFTVYSDFLLLDATELRCCAYSQGSATLHNHLNTAEFFIAIYNVQCKRIYQDHNGTWHCSISMIP